MTQTPNGHARPAPSRNGAAGPAPVPLPPSADGTPPAGKDPATGRFLPGNKLGRGNPHYRNLAENRTAFLQAVSAEQVRQLAAELLRRALAGDMDAARLVLAYAVGRPQPAVDPDGADRNEWQLRQAWPDTFELHKEGNKVCFRVAFDTIDELGPIPLAGGVQIVPLSDLFDIANRLKAISEKDAAQAPTEGAGGAH